MSCLRVTTRPCILSMTRVTDEGNKGKGRGSGGLTHSTPFIPTSILQVHETLRLDRSGQETGDSLTQAKLVDTANVEVENSVLK